MKRRIISFLLAVAMLLSLFPVSVFAMSDERKEELISGLEELYGDRSYAEEMFNALYTAGLIDENGDVVSIDMREDGTPVSLDELEERLMSGGTLGSITVNGKPVESEKVQQLISVKKALEFLRTVDTDVELTQEHLDNAQSLISQLQTSGLPTIETHDAPKKTMLLGAGAPMPNISITASIDKARVTNDCYEYGTYLNRMRPGESVTFTLSLSADPSVPVSIDYRTINGDYALKTPVSGTITWAVGDSAEKTVTVTLPDERCDHLGERFFVVLFDNVKNGVCLGSKGTETGFMEYFIPVAPKEEDKIVFGGYYTLTASHEFYTEDKVIVPEDYAHAVFGTQNYTPDAVSFGFGEENTFQMPENLRGHNFMVAVQLTPERGTLSQSKYGYLTNSKFDRRYLPKVDSTLRVDGKDVLTFGIEMIPGGGSTFEAFFAEGQCRSSNERKVYYDENSSIVLQKTYDELKDSVISVGGSILPDGFPPFFGDFLVGAIEPPTITIGGAGTATARLDIRENSKEMKVTGISIPSGKFYPNEYVPVTVTFDNYVAPWSSKTETLTLTINGVPCKAMLEEGSQQYWLTCERGRNVTFLYQVKDIDSGTIRIGEISGKVLGPDWFTAFTPTYDGLWTNIPGISNNDCKLISNAKRDSVKNKNGAFTGTAAILGDAAAQQTAAFRIDLRQDNSVYYDWVGSEATDTGSNPVTLKLPDGTDYAAEYYIPTGYLSCDGGATRYPLYIMTDEQEHPLALVANAAPPLRDTDTTEYYQLYFDPVPGEPEQPYLPAYSAAKQDYLGYNYFDGTGLAAAQMMESPMSVTAKGAVFLADGDVTVEGNEAWNNSHANYRISEDDDPGLQLSYKIADGKTGATFTDDKWFTWSSSNDQVAQIDADGTITPIDEGVCHFTLTVRNGDIEGKSFTVDSDELVVSVGEAPILTVPMNSQTKTVLKDKSVTLYFTTNLTKLNQTTLADESYVTEYTANVYNISDTEKTSPVNTEKIVSTTPGAITIPEGVLTALSNGAEDYVYTVVISAEYKTKPGEAGKIKSAEVRIATKLPPCEVKLGELTSYYVTSDSLPAIPYNVYGYTGGQGSDLYYTVSGGTAAGTRNNLSGASGTINLSGKLTPPTTLKDTYVVTVYAKQNAEDAYSVDSLRLTVYNPDKFIPVVADVPLGQIGGTTGGVGESAMNGVKINNKKLLEDLGGRGKVNDRESVAGTYSFNELRSLIGLQKSVSINYGTGEYGTLSDQIAWESSDNTTVPIEYKQGGMYSDIESYTYTSYAPTTDFLMVGLKDGTAQITATHARTGMEKTFEVDVTTMKDKLYMMKFSPATTCDVQYETVVDGKRIVVNVQTDSKGGLVLYEPNGIQSDIWVSDGGNYTGTFHVEDLASGEEDVSAGRVYPCNNMRLNNISTVGLSFIRPNGTIAASGESFVLRGGVYQNGVYCPDAMFQIDGDPKFYSGREDIPITLKNSGTVTIKMNPEEFYTDPETKKVDKSNISFVFEYRDTSGVYAPGIITISGKDRANTQLRAVTGSKDTPQIMSQTLTMYYIENGVMLPLPYSQDVIDYTETLGPSREFEQIVIESRAMMSDTEVQTVSNGYDENKPGYSAVPENLDARFDIVETGSGKLNTFGELEDPANVMAVDLSKINDPNVQIYTYPFSSMPVIRNCTTVNRDTLGKQAGSLYKADDGSEVYKYDVLGYRETTGLAARFYFNNKLVKDEMLKFNLTNLADQQDAIEGSDEISEDVKNKLTEKLGFGEVFKEVGVSDLISKGFMFLSTFKTENDNTVGLAFFPAEDPSTFRVLISINQPESDEDEEDQLSVAYDKKQLEKDKKEFQEKLDELTKKSKEASSGDKKDEDDGGEAKVEFKFYGMMEAEAVLGDDGKWGVKFLGGTIGAWTKISYEWSQNFMVGPVPVFVELGASAGTDLSFSIANKNTVDMLIKVTLEAGLEAFAGLGFDLSLVALKCGIFGKIGIKLDCLFLAEAMKKASAGTRLAIEGEIGVKFEVKVVLITYKKTIASAKFGWQWFGGKYEAIDEYWNEDGESPSAKKSAPRLLKGFTRQGDPYTAELQDDGTVLFTITQEETESRDYLKNGGRTWNSGAAPKKLLAANPGAAAGSSLPVQTNAYPYSNPVTTDDGQIMLYISDLDDPNSIRSSASFATANATSYDNKGAIASDLSEEDQSVSDSFLTASGSGSQYFAAWVGQVDDLDVAPAQDVENSDTALMMNATEVYAAVYNGNGWNTTRMTKNDSADMSPSVSSSGDKAILAWRNISGSSFSFDGETDLNECFDIDNTIVYSYYTGGAWKQQAVAYNGSLGTVNSVDTAMLSDGTAMIVYTVKTGEADEDIEVLYTIVGADGTVSASGRLTNDSYLDNNAQVEVMQRDGKDVFLTAWYARRPAFRGSAEVGTKTEEILTGDVCLAAINSDGSVRNDVIESIGKSASSLTSDFKLLSKQGAEFSDITLVWLSQTDGEAEGASCYSVKGVRFYEDDNAQGISAPQTLYTTADWGVIDSYDAYIGANGSVTVTSLVSDYAESNLSTVGEISLNSQKITELPKDGTPSEDTLRILAAEPTCNIVKASGQFDTFAFDVSEPVYSDSDIMKGFDLPVSFTVKNTGTGVMNGFTVTVAGDAVKYNVALNPGDETAARKMNEINAAYDQIKNGTAQSGAGGYGYSGGQSGMEMMFTETYDDAFTDSGSIASWAKPAVYWAYYHELISGTSSTTITPTGLASRGQLAKILVNYSEKFGN